MLKLKAQMPPVIFPNDGPRTEARLMFKYSSKTHRSSPQVLSPWKSLGQKVPVQYPSLSLVCSWQSMDVPRPFGPCTCADLSEKADNEALNMGIHRSKKIWNPIPLLLNIFHTPQIVPITWKIPTRPWFRGGANIRGMGITH